MQAVLTVLDTLNRQMLDETARQIAEALGTSPERLLFQRYRFQFRGATMPMTYSIVLATLKLVRDVPDVIPVADLVNAGMDDPDMRSLANNHKSEMITSTDRYKGGVFAVDSLLAEADGVYTPDLLIYLAGKLKVAWQSPFETGGANVRYMKSRIEDAAVAGGGQA